MDRQFLIACQNGNLDKVEYLLENKADITVQNNRAVRLASENGRLEMVEYLVKMGADITAENNSAVCLAGENGRIPCRKRGGYYRSR